MKCNQAGRDIIKSFESLALKTYTCPAGKLTIGYGHTGTGVLGGMEITAAQAEDLLAQDLARTETVLTRSLKVAVTDNEFSALVSLAFNVGTGNVQSSTLLRILNQGLKLQAAAEFPKWNRAAGRVLDGLTRRREAEKALFLT